jgi:hypothetical protein
MALLTNLKLLVYICSNDMQVFLICFGVNPQKCLENHEFIGVIQF